jgi:hypothetical protein
MAAVGVKHRCFKKQCFQANGGWQCTFVGVAEALAYQMVVKFGSLK